MALLRRRGYHLMKALMVMGIVAILAACSPDKKEEPDKDTVSEDVTKIIDTMMTCPNDKLFSKASVAVVGMDAQDEETEQEEGLDEEEINKNWEDEVGQYFAKGSLQEFLTEGPATMYLMQSAIEGVDVSVEKITLAEKTDTYERYWLM